MLRCKLELPNRVLVVLGGASWGKFTELPKKRTYSNHNYSHLIRDAMEAVFATCAKTHSTIIHKHSVQFFNFPVIGLEPFNPGPAGTDTVRADLRVLVYSHSASHDGGAQPAPAFPSIGTSLATSRAEKCQDKRAGDFRRGININETYYTYLLVRRYTGFTPKYR